MLCFSGFQLYSRWVPLFTIKDSIFQFHQMRLFFLKVRSILHSQCLFRSKLQLLIRNDLYFDKREIQ